VSAGSEAEARFSAVPTSEMVLRLRDEGRETGGGENAGREVGPSRPGLGEIPDGKTDPEQRTGRISLHEIASATEGRSHGLMLLLLALPETIPMVGLSLILATPVFVIGILMVRHGPSFPLPRWLGRRTLKRSLMNNAIDRALPSLRRLDRILKPRWTRVVEAGRVQGAVCVVMALVLAVPIPGANILAAFAVAGMGLGILQHDGLAVAAASAMAVLALLATAGAVTGVGLLVRG
jgi:hypothetical protein